MEKTDNPDEIEEEIGRVLQGDNPAKSKGTSADDKSGESTFSAGGLVRLQPKILCTFKAENSIETQ